MSQCEGRQWKRWRPSRSRQNVKGIAECLETLAAVGAARLEMERAATLAGAAASIREAIASRPAPFDVVITGRLLDRTKSTMTEKRWHRTWEKGRALDSVAAVATR